MEKEYKDFIIDLRYNTGGNSGILEEALNKHKEFLKKQNYKDKHTNDQKARIEF